VDQIKLVLPDFFGAEFVGRFAEVLAELIDVKGVGIDRALGEVPQLHVFGHALNRGVESFLVRRHAWLLSSVGWSVENPVEHPVARRSSPTMLVELITQDWLAWQPCANGLWQE
jgi:hypothetical protein